MKQYIIMPVKVYRNYFILFILNTRILQESKVEYKLSVLKEVMFVNQMQGIK